jgi:hypothetical protein
MAEITLTSRDMTAHDQHLCTLADYRQMLTVAKLAKDAKYMCVLCGRAAASTKPLPCRAVYPALVPLGTCCSGTANTGVMPSA